MPLTSFLFGRIPKATVIGETLIVDASIKIITTRKVTLTKNPIEDNSNVTDHAILENLELQIEGLISEAPLDSLASLLGGLVGGAFASNIPRGGIGALGGSVFGSAVANQFKSFNPGDNKGQPTQTGLEDQIKNRRLNDSNFPLEKAAKYLVKALEDRRPFSIVTKFDKFQNMVITSLEIPQESVTGDSLRFTMTCEQIQIVNTEDVPLPENIIASSISHSATDKVDGGAGQGTPKDADASVLFKGVYGTPAPGTPVVR